MTCFTSGHLYHMQFAIPAAQNPGWSMAPSDFSSAEQGALISTAAGAGGSLTKSGIYATPRALVCMHTSAGSGPGKHSRSDTTRLFLRNVPRGAPVHRVRWSPHHYRPTSNHSSRKWRIPQQAGDTRNATFFSHWLFVWVRSHEV